MPRIKRLENEELGYLRDRIRQVYQNRHPTENLPILNAYLPNYEELKSDILRQVPDALGSVSENRLRKLYYYTDSEHHSENGLQSPNFGIDFLDACYRYISENNFDREGYRNRSVVNTTEKKPAVIWFRVALIGVILAGCGWWLWPKPGQVDLGHLPIKEGFDDNSMPALQERGWNLMDPDTPGFTEQDRPGYYKFFTLPGSFWTKPQEPISVPNTLVRSIPEEATGVRACFDAFVPEQNWQSIGMVLFNADLDRQDLIYMSFGFAGSLEKEGHSPWVISATRLRSGVPDMPFFTKLVQLDQNTGEKVRLDLNWTEDELRFFTGVNEANGFTEEWDPFMQIGALEMPFEPAYVGLFACQGWTNDDLEPLQADTIPAYLDWVEIY